jgi:flagellar motor switch protein FliG
MTLEEQDKYILDDDDFDVTELGDTFEEKCLANIEEHVHQSFAEEVKRHTFTIPQMSNISIRNISEMLRDMNEVIKSRIVNQ